MGQEKVSNGMQQKINHRNSNQFNCVLYVERRGTLIKTKVPKKCRTVSYFINEDSDKIII